MVLENLRNSSKDMDFIFYLDKHTLILTKILVGRDEDYDDFAKLLPSPGILPKEELINRFKKIIPAKGNS